MICFGLSFRMLQSIADIAYCRIQARMISIITGNPPIGVTAILVPRICSSWYDRDWN